MFSNNSLTLYVVATALTVSVLSFLIWNKKKKNYVRVGKISKLFFYPVKSLKAVDVTQGKCTKLGFEVNGLLDRSFMIVNENGVLVSQRDAPTLVSLTPHIKDNYLIINAPNKEPLKVEIKKSPYPNEKVVDCHVHTDVVGGIDCGDESASWFQSYLKMEGVRLVQFYSSKTKRKYTKKDQFYIELRKKHPAGFQDLVAFHVVSQASIDDINSKQDEKKITVYNFRPNILFEECEAFAEDSWRYMKFASGAELQNLILTTRCRLTTNDPEKGILDNREPLISLRKYRIPADPEMLKITGSIPCLGTGCAVLSPGEIEIGNDVFAVVEGKPNMKVKET